MTPRSSLRSRLLLGAVLWTIGLSTVTGVGLTQIMLVHPHAPRVVHRTFAHVIPLSILAVVCMIVGVFQVRRGLSPLEQLRTRLAALRAGITHEIEGRYPAEVQPVVDDLNMLLDQRGKAVARALAKAGDLAHGLKTPLAVLAQESERAAAAGHRELAALIDQQVERMRRQMDYHLAHARAAASGAAIGARCSVAASAEGLARTLRRLHADRGLTIDVSVSEEMSIRGQREDLDEMLGNLIENACKWARSRVTIRASAEAVGVAIVVEDDGPGLDPSMREAVLARGVRADESAPGTGFGLAIVRDLADLYGGSITLGTSPLGGLQAQLRLPAARDDERHS
jgi:signal transduction histidine kinase